jgi:hypothetical protein
MKWVGKVVSMRKARNSYKVMVAKPEETRPF